MQRLRRNQGQSIVFMAILILVLIAFAGLSIDTGNAMSSQRKIQAASNSAALGGMNMVVRNDSDAAVQAAILQSLNDNGVTKYKQVYTNPPWNDADPETVYFRAQYLNSTGEPILNDIGAQPNVLPRSSGVQFVHVITSIKVNNTFASAVGVPTYTVNADGIAGIATCKQGVYPITFDQKYLFDAPGYRAPVIARNPDAPAASFEARSRFKVWKKVRDPEGNFLWIRWNGDQQQGSAGALENSMTFPGNLTDGFAERTPPTGSTNGPTPGELEAGDWVAGDTGNVNSSGLVTQLDYHINNRTRMILPIYDTTYGQGNSPGAGYHMIKFVKVRLLSYDLNGNDGYFEFGLIEDNAFCTDLRPGIPEPLPHTVTARFDEQLLWYQRNAGIKSYDLVIVQDYSASMAYKWDSDEYTGYPNRRIDSAITTVNSFVKEMLDTRVNTYGAENRLAYVTFGPNGGAQKVVDFTTNPNAFTPHTGYGQAGYQFPSGTVGGNTPTAHGLASAVTLLNSARRVDSKGNPVKLAVLLVTDGLANIFYGGGQRYDGKANTQSQFNCAPQGVVIPDTVYLSDPYWQSTCPTSAMSGNVKPPIISAVEVANAARSNKNIVFYAVVIGYQAGRTPEDLHMNEIAPGNYAMAGNAAQLNNIIGNISQELFSECTDGISTTRTAAGAQVTIKEKVSGAIVATTTLDNQGRITKVLPDGSYIISASHLGVVAPDDAFKIPRNYTLLSQTGGNQLVPQLEFKMEGGDVDLSPSSPILITIDNPDNAKCP